MNKLSFCSSCNAQITFALTKKNNQMPVDFSSLSVSEKKDAVNNIQIPFVYGRHISHFATCPDAKQFRKNNA